VSLKAELQVEGKSNDEYKAVIEKKLNGIDGVNNYNIDQKSKKVKVTYDDTKINLVDIKGTIMEEGFSVIEI